ncbi:MAG: superoxide dismutase family protein [Gemmatimonadales bacterium]
MALPDQSGWGIVGALLLLTACEGDRREQRESSAGADTTVPAMTSSETAKARATIAGPPGSGIKGEVTFVELAGNAPVPGVEIEARITGPADRLTPGPHGLHIHEVGSGACVPPYKAAQGHFDPGPAANPDPDVNHPFHLGDIPNLVVDRNGAGVVEATTSRITLSPGPLSLFDANGSSVIVHEKPDQGIPGPAGSGVSGGPRIACGVIELE